MLREVEDEVVGTHDGRVGVEGPFRPDRPVQAAEGVRGAVVASAPGAPTPGRLPAFDVECSLDGTLPLGVPIREIRPI